MMSNEIEECPKCKGCLLVIEDYSTFERTEICQRCGYYFDWSIQWENREEDKPLYDEKGRVIYKETTGGGFGRLMIRYEREVIDMPLEQSISEEEIEKYKALFEADGVEKEQSFLIVRNGESFDVVFGTVTDFEISDYAVSGM